MKYLVGIDMGTLGTKCMIFDENGEAIAYSFEQHVPPYQPNPYISEQDPADWWSAVCKTTAETMKRSGVSPSDVLCIGLSSQGGGLVCLDSEDNPVRPAMIYSDIRAHKEAQELIEKLGRDRLMKLHGNTIPTLRINASSPVSKIQWMKKHEPVLFEKTERFLYSKTYLCYKLTGEPVFDDYSASGTGVGNFDTMRWIPQLLDEIEISADSFGKICRAWEIAGHITEKASKETGLPEGTPVSAGVWDGMCNIVGSGCAQRGDLMDVTGTTEIITLLEDKIPPNFRPCFPYFHQISKGLWVWYSSPRPTGAILAWFAKEFADTETQLASRLGENVFRFLDLEAERSPPGSRNLIFFPHTSGMMSPVRDLNARGFFLGVTLSHHRSDFIRAIMEGIAYGIRHSLEVFKKEGGNMSETISVSGGGSNSDLWNKIKCDVLGRNVETLSVSETGCLGAAILGAIGIKLYSSIEDATGSMVQAKEKLEPRKYVHQKYSKLFRLYLKAYENLGTTFAELASVEPTSLS